MKVLAPPSPPVFLDKVSETLGLGLDLGVWVGRVLPGLLVGWGVLGVGFVK